MAARWGWVTHRKGWHGTGGASNGAREQQKSALWNERETGIDEGGRRQAGGEDETGA